MQAIFRVLQEFREGQRSPENFLEALDGVHDWLEGWFTQVESLGEPCPEAPDLLDATFEDLALLQDATEHLRRYAVRRDEELAERALVLAAQGRSILEELCELTAATVAELEDQI